MSDFREAQADESVMISFARYSPRCVERLYEKWFSGGDPLL
jgi:hypothetical protein